MATGYHAILRPRLLQWRLVGSMFRAIQRGGRKYKPGGFRAVAERLEGRRLLAVTPIHSASQDAFDARDDEVVEYHNRLYFASWDSKNGTELWSSDGTSQGTSLVCNIQPSGTPSIEGMQVVGDQLFFSVQYSNSEAQFALWRSDGTASGTYKLTDYTTGLNENLSGPVQVGNDVFFSTPGSIVNSTILWRTDGTIQGTVPVLTATTANRRILALASYGGSLYFTALADDNLNHTILDTQLLRTDGTEGGTSVLSSFDSVDSDVYSNAYFAQAGNTLYFAEPGDYRNSVIWGTQGTADTTAPMTFSLNGQMTTETNPDWLVEFKDKLLIRDSKRGWYTTDGTTATLLPDLKGNVTVEDDYLYSANSSGGFVIVRSDGTSASSTMVMDARGSGIIPSSATQFQVETAFGGSIYFTFNGSKGTELWTVGSNSTNPHQMDVVNPVGEFVPFNGNAYYMGYTIGANDALSLYSLDPGTATIAGSISTPFQQNNEDQPLPDESITLYLDLNHDGQFDNDEPSSITDANGEFWIGDVAPGQYTLGLVGPTSTWRFYANTSPNANALTVTVGADETWREPLSAADTAPAIVSGRVFRDQNGNGTPDPGEGKSFIVYDDLNYNGKLDAGESWARSDANGNYQLSVSNGGVQPLEIVPVKGWDVGQFGSPAYVYITAVPGQTVTYNPRVAKMEAVNGYLFKDLNGDGKRQSNEPAIVGQMITVQAFSQSDSGGGGAIIHFAVSSSALSGKEWKVRTDSHGHYTVNLPVQNDANFFFDPPTIKGLRQTNDNNFLQPKDGATVTLNLGMTNRVLVAGAVYQNGIIGETPSDGSPDPMQRWTIYLDKFGLSGINSGEQKVLTNVGGWFTFPSMPSGTYIVRVIPKKGYKFKKSSSQALKLGPGAVSSSCYFEVVHV